MGIIELKNLKYFLVAYYEITKNLKNRNDEPNMSDKYWLIDNSFQTSGLAILFVANYELFEIRISEFQDDRQILSTDHFKTA